MEIPTYEEIFFDHFATCSFDISAWSSCCTDEQYWPGCLNAWIFGNYEYGLTIPLGFFFRFTPLKYDIGKKDSPIFSKNCRGVVGFYVSTALCDVGTLSPLRRRPYNAKLTMSYSDRSDFLLKWPHLHIDINIPQENKTIVCQRWNFVKSPRSTQTHKRGGGIIDIGIPAKQWQIEQNFVVRGIGKLWVGFRYVQIPTPNTPLTPKIEDLKNSQFK